MACLARKERKKKRRGNRVYKWSYDGNTPAAGKRYIVDISGGLPVILCEIVA
jgi:hypothetical protein